MAVDWAKLPVPEDDGAADHLMGLSVPDVALPSTGGNVSLSCLDETVVVFAYPRMGRPGEPLPEGWDLIPGARGCTPQACAFRDLYSELQASGARYVFGLSTQSASDQLEAAARLQLPFPLLSDSDLELAGALRLPTMVIDGETLLKRLTLIINGGLVWKVFYPVFPPDRNAEDVLAWLRATVS
jgi:peroxiredoxin